MTRTRRALNSRENTSHGSSSGPSWEQHVRRPHFQQVRGHRLGVPDFCDVRPRTHRMRFLRVEREGDFGCCQTQSCTARWLRCEGAVGAGRSRRPRRTRVCGAGSTRIHQTGMEEPAIGAAATERWSVRGPGMGHGVGPLTASELNPVPKGEQGLRRMLHCESGRGQCWLSLVLTAEATTRRGYHLSCESCCPG